MKVARGSTRLLVAISLIFGALVPGLLAPINDSLAADTPEMQQKKARALIESRRQRARASKSAGCAFGKVVTAGVDTTGLLVIIFCPASGEYIWGEARNELKQDILAMGLAAMSSGKHIIVDVVDGIITAFAITEFPIDDR